MKIEEFISFWSFKTRSYSVSNVLKKNYFLKLQIAIQASSECLERPFLHRRVAWCFLSPEVASPAQVLWLQMLFVDYPTQTCPLIDGIDPFVKQTLEPSALSRGKARTWPKQHKGRRVSTKARWIRAPVSLDFLSHQSLCPGVLHKVTQPWSHSCPCLVTASNPGRVPTSLNSF